MTRPSTLRAVPICCLLLAVFLSPAAAEDKKEAVPEKPALEKAEKTIKSVFQADYAKRTPTAMHDLGTKLLKQASETNDDVAARYVMLREAQDLTARAGDYLAAFKAIDEMDRLYTINAIQMKATAVEVAARSFNPAQTAEETARTSLALVELALAREEYDVAKRLVTIADATARKAKVVALVTTAQNWTRSLDAQKKEQEGMKPALETLQSKPDDPEACAKVGRYLCLYNGNWEKGLALLAKGNDDKLQKLAKNDLNAPKDANVQAEIGEAWYDLAEGLDEAAKNHVQMRALHWYKRALEGTLAAEGKAKVEKRVAELDKKPEDGWTVIFRSADPRAWNKNVRERGNFGIEVKNAPEELKYVRLANTRTGEYVIVAVTKEKLASTSDDGRYGWCGTAKFEYTGYHLGVYDTENNGKDVKPFVCIYVPGVFQGHGGWGFGHIGGDKGPGYAWEGKAIQTTVFEIAVKSGDLTESESKKLLKK